MSLVAYNVERLRPVIFVLDTGENCFGTYTPDEIIGTTLPMGVYAYQCKHAEGNLYDPVTIENFVTEDFVGTFIMSTPILNKKGGNISLNISTIIWLDTHILTTQIYFEDLIDKKQKELLPFFRNKKALTFMRLATIDLDVFKID